MNTKTTMIVALIAVVIGAYVMFIEKPWEEAATDTAAAETQARLLFEPKIEKAEIQRIELAFKDEKIAFARDGEENWKMLEPVEAPAIKYNVEPIIDTLAELEYLKRFESTSRDRPDEKAAGLDAPQATVKLLGKGDKVAAQLAVGDRAPTGKGYYVRAGGEGSIYETQGLKYDKDLAKSLTDKRAPEYRDKQVVRGKIEDVVSVKVEGLSSFEIVKSGDDWMIESPTRGRADKSKADSVARQAGVSLSAQDWADETLPAKTYGLDKPRLKVTVAMTVPPKAKPGDPDTQPADTQPSTETKVLLVGGAKDLESKAFYAKFEDAPAVFSLAEYAVKQLAPGLSELRDKQLAKVELGKVSKITAKTAGGSMTLAKEEGQWSFGDGTRPDGTAVTDLINAVRELKAADFEEPGQMLIDVDWANPRAEVSITQQGERNPVTLLVGQQTTSGKMVYVRNAADDVIAVVHEDDVAQLLLPPVSYRDRKVMSFPGERADRVEIVRADGDDVVLAKEGTAWSLVEPVSASADATAVRDLLQDLSSLRAKHVAGEGDRAAFGLDKPTVTLAVQVQPLTADPNTKVVGEDTAETQPASEPPTEGGGSSSETKPAAVARSAKSSDDLSPEQIQAKIANLEGLLQYQKDNPDEEKPELTALIRRDLEELRAKTRPAGDAEPGSDAPPRTDKDPEAVAEATTQPAEPPAPTVFRLHLSRRDDKTYACLDDGDLIYELDGKVYDDATAEMHDRQIAKFEVADVMEVSFGTGSDEIVLRKSGEDWKYAADPVLPIDKQKVTDSLNAFRDMKTHRYVAYAADPDALARYKLDAEPNRASVVLEGGQRIVILLAGTGPEGDPDESRYAMLADSGKVFLLKKEQADKFAKRLEDFEKAASS